MDSMKVLIAYDDSDCSRSMLIDLAQAGLGEEVEATVLSFAEVWLPEPEQSVTSNPAGIDAYGNVDQSRSRTEYREAIAIAEEGCARVAAMFPQWRVGCEAHADAATWGTMEKVREWNPGLVVVGSHGRSALGRLIHGSVGQKLLMESPCSVRIARAPHGAQLGGLRIILAVDGSHESNAAIASVASRRWPAGTSVRVLSVYDQRAIDTGVLTMATPATITQDDSDLEIVEDRATFAVAELSRAGIAAQPIVAVGNPAATIIEEAERWGADAIFLGARGHGLVERALMGSVSNGVAMRAPCSVEVVRIHG